MIPADLLGNMWAQEWGNIYDIVAPAFGAVRPTMWARYCRNRHATPGRWSRYGEELFQVAGLSRTAGNVLGAVAC